MYEATKQGIEIALKKIGYIRYNRENESVSILCKADQNNSKVVLVVETYKNKIFNEEDYLDKLSLADNFSHIDKDHVFVVLIGKPEYSCREKNYVIVNVHTGKYRMSVTKTFQEERKVIRQYLDEIRSKNRLNKFYLAKEDCCYSTVGIWIPILFITLCFLKTWWFYGDTYGISADTVLNQGQSYRLFSYMFVHASIRHLVGNMIALYTIGRAYASRNGMFETITIFLTGGFFAGLYTVTTALRIGNVNTYTVGCSGAIFAILGALAFDVVTDKKMKGNKMHIVTYALITFLLSSIGWNVSISCHLGGVVAGIFLKFVIDMIERIYQNERTVCELRKWKG